jgi:hypothetical protein
MAVAREPNVVFVPFVATNELLFEESPPPPIVMT